MYMSSKTLKTNIILASLMTFVDVLKNIISDAAFQQSVVRGNVYTMKRALMRKMRGVEKGILRQRRVAVC